MLKKDKLLGYNLSISFRAAKGLFDRRMAKFGIQHSQFIFVMALYEGDGISQDELARRVNLDKPSVSRAINKLESGGYIRKEIDSHDHRVNRIFLTSKTLDMREEIFSTLRQINNRITDGISKENLEITNSVLRKVRDNIESLNIEGWE